MYKIGKIDSNQCNFCKMFRKQLLAEFVIDCNSKAIKINFDDKTFI